MTKSLGQIAYEAFTEIATRKKLSWENISEHYQTAWEAAAAAVAAECHDIARECHNDGAAAGLVADFIEQRVRDDISEEGQEVDLRSLFKNPSSVAGKNRLLKSAVES